MNDIVWLITILVGILAVFGTAAIAGLLAAPWLPVRKRELAKLFELLSLKQGSTLYDLGCGDGRIMIEAVKRYNVTAHGYEISLLPYIASLLRLRIFPKRNRVHLHYKNFYTISLGEADTIFCFLTPAAMQKLKPKFLDELGPGARIISYAFQVSGWHASEELRPFPNSIRVFVYDIDVIRSSMV